MILLKFQCPLSEKAKRILGRRKYHIFGILKSDFHSQNIMLFIFLSFHIWETSSLSTNALLVNSNLTMSKSTFFSELSG